MKKKLVIVLFGFMVALNSYSGVGLKNLVRSLPAIARKIKTKDSISYATVVLFNEESEVLLLRRTNTTFGEGLYSLPGGKIEAGETALEGARREVLEEVGVVLYDLELVHVLDRQGSETEFYIFMFKPVSWEGIPRNCEITKFDHMGWFSLDALPENIIPGHLQALEMFQKKVMYSEHGYSLNF